MNVAETIFKMTEDEKAEATVAIIEWFGKQGRAAYEKVLELQPDPAHLTECVAWLEDLAEEARNG